MKGKELAPRTAAAEVILASGVDKQLSRIRGEWQAKSLIKRVARLLPVDPSSACQRLLNAAIHDLREKIVIAGLDVAQEAADQHGLPQAKKTEQVYAYSTTHTLDISYHMGLLSRPEWRKLKRAYDIRKDLEHEDDEYEAGMEDCIYIFSTCIDIVLSRDPISPVRVVDVRDIIESPESVILSTEVLEDFSGAPTTRQVEIGKFLISVSNSADQTDIVRQNAVEALRSLESSIRTAARAELGKYVQQQLKSRQVNLVDMKIAAAAGITSYLKKSKVKKYFGDYYTDLSTVGYRWTCHAKHGKLLDDFDDVGGLEATPEEIRREIVRWMVLCYIGETGGYGMGRNRPVFYSDSAAQRIRRMFQKAGSLIGEDVELASKDKKIRAVTSNKHIARRLDQLRDLTCL